MPITVLETEKLNIPKEGITILEFYADWCVPCKTMDPTLKDLSERDINIIKVDTDKLPKLTSEYQIASIPTMFIYKDGELKEKQVGVINLGVLLLIIQSLKEPL